MEYLTLSSDIIEFEMKKVRKYSLFDLEYEFEYARIFFIYSYSYSKFEFKLKIFEVIFDHIRKLSNLSNSFNFCQIIFNKNHLKV